VGETYLQAERASIAVMGNARVVEKEAPALGLTVDSV
jgi:hypothetical protein